MSVRLREPALRIPLHIEREMLIPHEVIVHRVLPENGWRVAPLDRAPAFEQPADAPSRSLVLDECDEPLGVLFLSARANPSLVARSVGNARTAKRLLGTDLGSVVLEPLQEGVFEGLSYTLWPWRRPFGPSRAVAFVQKRVARPRVFRWLIEAAAQTLRAPADDHLHDSYRLPLIVAANDVDLPPGLRETARAALHRLDRGEWRPVSILEHGDSWVGNILLPARFGGRSEHTRGFVIIDWGGMKTQGYPFLDLIRLSRSFGTTPQALRREMADLCRALGCRSIDAFSYLAAGLGAMAKDLEHFSRERYLTLANTSYETLFAAVGDLR